MALDVKPFYYQRNWTDALPSFNLRPSLKANALHAAGLALPFIGTLYQPAGKAISYVSCFMHGVDGISRDGKSVWDLAKFIVELGALTSGLKEGQVAHTAMNLTENFWALRQVKSRGDALQKMMPVVSNILYLTSLLPLSRKMIYAVMAASLSFQAAMSLHKAYVANNKKQRLDTVAHLALAVVYGAKAYTCGEAFYKIHTAVSRIFILMRPASKSSKTTGGLSPKGQKLAVIKRDEVQAIAAEYKKDSIQAVTSPAKHHQETGEAVSRKPVETEPDLRERTQTGWQIIANREERKSHPDYIHYNHELSSAKKWVTPPDPQDPRSESQAALAQRLDGAIRKVLTEHDDPSELPVIVSGGTIIQNWVKSLLWENICLPISAAKRFKDGEIMVVEVTPDENGYLRVTDLKRKKP